MLTSRTVIITLESSSTFAAEGIAVNYFVSYELLPNKGGATKHGTCVITGSSVGEIQTDIASILNDNGGSEDYSIRVLCLTLLPAND